MSDSIEDRIVAMKFENKDFEKGVSQSLSSWQKLESVLNKGIQAKGLSDVQAATGRFNMNPMEAALAGVSKSWLALSTVAVTALATVTSSVIRTGGEMVKSLTLDPVLQGFGEYSTNLNSIQTVLANTQAAGTNLDDVNGALQQLNHYSDKTIYNFGEMAKNIGTFTAAGVGLQDSVDSIKGIANLAALSGSSSEQASTAMYQLSQAIAAGRVGLQDWNSVVNAGMGGATFQRALAQTAEAMGTIDKSAINIDKSTGKMTINGASFRDSISAIGGEKWLTSDVLTNTLSQFTGDLTDAQLAAQGFSKEQIKSIQLTAKTAQEAATKVKTISQVMDVAKETIGSGWSLTFQHIFGNFEEARTTFTSMSNFINHIINQNSKARNKVLKDWGALGGRTKIISAVTNAWKALMSVLGPIHDAFREIFPAKTGEQLFQLSKGLNQFFRHLRLTADAQENLKNTFAGFFAVLHIGFTIVSGIAHVLFTLIGLFVKGQGSTLAFTGGIGQMLVALDAFLTKGKFVENFFNGLANALVFILKPLLDIRSALISAFAALITGDPGKFFDGISNSVKILLTLVDGLSSKFASVINTISDAMGGLGHVQGLNLAGMFGGAGGGKEAAKSIGSITDSVKGLKGPSLDVKGIWDGIVNAFHAVGDFFKPLTDQFGKAFSALHDAFAGLFSGKGLNFDQFIQVINTGLFLGIFLTIRKASNAFADIGGAAEGVLKQVTSNLKSMQADVRSDVILKIAIALGILAASIYVLSLTDPQQLGVALGALSAMLIGLVVAVKVLEKGVDGWKGGAKLALVSAGMIGMATALAIMAGAVYLFSKIDPKSMGQGMLNISLALALLTGAAVAMTKSGAGANMIGAATGLLIMSAALVAMSGAIKLFSAIDGDTLTSGLVKIAATIGVLALAMNLMKTGVGGAAAMFIVSAALVVLSKALGKFAAMSGKDIFKALATMGAAMLILVIGMNAMESAIPGAIAAFIVAEAILVLGTAIAVFGQMDIGTVVKGLLLIVGVMAALALAAAVMAPAVLILAGFAAVLFLIGSGVFLAGTGLLAFATALALLSQNGGKGIKNLENIILDFVNFLPTLVDAFGKVLDAVAKLIGDHAPNLAAAFYQLMGKMLDAGTKLLPKIGKFISKLIETALRVLVSYYSDMARAGLKLIENLLNAVAKAVPRIAEQAGNIAIAFVNALAKQAVRFANAAAQAIVDFLNGLADAIRNHQTQMNAAGGNVALAIISGVTAPLRNAGEAILAALNVAWNWAKDHFSPHVSIGGHKLFRTDADALTGTFAKLVGGTDQVSDALTNISAQIHDALDKSSSDIDKYKQKLKELKKADHPDQKAIKEAKKKLQDALDLQDAAQKALEKYKKAMKEHGQELKGLAARYDAVMAKLDEWKGKLADALQAQEDFKKGVIDAFGTPPNIEAGESLAAYMRQLQQQQAKIEKFKATLAALQAAGLSPEAYQYLLSQGVDAQHLMDQLLAGGPDAIKQFEAASGGLFDAAKGLADMASQFLGYDAAVATAQNWVNGLTNGLTGQDSLASIEAAMGKIAKIMMKAIKKQLEIKSPSRKGAEVGRYTTLGIAKGMIAATGSVVDAAKHVGTAALDTLQDVMNKPSNQAILDMVPTITPVLDLNKFAVDAAKMAGMLEAQPLVANVSYETAAGISNDQRASQDANVAAVASPTTLEYTQILQSPKAISPIDTYRATKSAIPLMKEALNV